MQFIYKKLAIFIGLLALFSSPALADQNVLAPQLTLNEGQQYGRVEIHLPLGKDYENPFDAKEVLVQGHFQAPDGTMTDVDGFLDQDYDMAHGDKDRWDHLTPRGGTYWAVRFMPTAEGEYTWWVTVKDDMGEVSSAKASFTTKANPSAQGFIKVSPNHTHFQFDNGSAFYPIATCLAWTTEGGMFDYEKWFSVFSQNGGNMTRIFMTWMNMPLDRIKTPTGGWDMHTTLSYVKRYVFPDLNERTQNGASDPGMGAGRIDLANAWRYDYLLNLAQHDGIRLMFCQTGFAEFGPTDGWLINPYNKANGGMLDKPEDFFTDPNAKALFKQRLRYVVARYAWSPNVFAWELFNEVDEIGRHTPQGFPVEACAAWHQEMARYLKQIDPYKHMVTTSVAFEERDALFTLPEIDFAQIHGYNFQDSATEVALENARQSMHFGKPHMFGEFGLEFLQRSHFGGPMTDPKGIHIETGLWASLASPGGGTVSPWYWDNYMEPQQLWPLWKPVAQFAANVPWNKVQWTPLQPLTIRYPQTSSDAPRQTLKITPPYGWSTPPTPFKVNPDGTLEGNLYSIPLYIKGSDHPLVFQVNYAQAGQFQVEIRCVSKDGARLEVRLDGQPLINKEFAGGAKDYQFQFNANYTIEVPAGAHTIAVADPGDKSGIFSATYDFINYLDPEVAPLKAYGMLGDSSVGVIYLYNQDYTWGNVNSGGKVIDVAPSTLIIPGLKPGAYDVEIWSPSQGVKLDQRKVNATPGGLPIELPSIKNDLAIKILPSP